MEYLISVISKIYSAASRGKAGTMEHFTVLVNICEVTHEIKQLCRRLVRSDTSETLQETKARRLTLDTHRRTRTRSAYLYIQNGLLLCGILHATSIAEAIRE